MSGETQTQSSKPQNGFEETLKDFWCSRPRRPVNGRKVAGVAAGIGNRYGLDPVVVRVALVAATVFGGIGLVVYLLGWLLFADERDEVSPFEAMIGQGYSSTSRGFTVVLCVLLLPTTGWSFSGGWFGGSGVIGLALIVAAIYLLHRNRGQFNRPVAAAPAAGYGADASFSMSQSATEPVTSPAAPPAWDPLSASPSGWDLPDPDPQPEMSHTPPPAPPARTSCGKSKIGIATFGVAILVAGAGAALDIAGFSWFSPQHIVGLTLGVIGIGLVAGAFVRGGRGLIGLAVPLAIAGMVLTAVPFHDFGGGFGNIDATPKTAAEVLPSYHRSAGDINLDLRQLSSEVPVTTSLSSGAGSTTVLVSPTADVRFTCDNKVGNVDCLGHKASGVGNAPVTGVDNGVDGVGGQKITLNIQNATGNVKVLRG